MGGKASVINRPVSTSPSSPEVAILSNDPESIELYYGTKEDKLIESNLRLVDKNSWPIPSKDEVGVAVVSLHRFLLHDPKYSEIIALIKLIPLEIMKDVMTSLLCDKDLWKAILNNEGIKRLRNMLNSEPTRVDVSDEEEKKEEEEEREPTEESAAENSDSSIPLDNIPISPVSPVAAPQVETQEAPSRHPDKTDLSFADRLAQLATSVKSTSADDNTSLLWSDDSVDYAVRILSHHMKAGSLTLGEEEELAGLNRTLSLQLECFVTLQQAARRINLGDRRKKENLDKALETASSQQAEKEKAKEALKTVEAELAQLRESHKAEMDKIWAEAKEVAETKFTADAAQLVNKAYFEAHCAALTNAKTPPHDLLWYKFQYPYPSLAPPLRFSWEASEESGDGSSTSDVSEATDQTRPSFFERLKFYGRKPNNNKKVG